MALTTPPQEDLLMKAIRDAVREQLHRITEEEYEKAAKRVKERIPDVISSISLKLFSHLSYENMGQQIVMKINVDGWGEK